MIKHDEILDAIRDRKEWENRQATWYAMRHDGLRRKNKPWANAADMHWPLADAIIEKLKPYYVQQIFATDTVASFVALQELFSAYQAAAGQWFDYQLKQRSNFEGEMCITPDVMLQTGKCPVKVYWDAAAKRLTFEAINPLYLIVPPWTTRLEHADWIVHVQPYSVAAYKRLKGFKTDAATITAITEGDGSSADSGTGSYETRRRQREGITHTTNKEQIIVWEVFARDEKGQWRVKTYSPAKPDLELRAEFGLPYNQGIFGQPMPPPPFAEFNAEAKDRGYYAPRGVCERVAPFEASLCKDWNTMKDYQTLTCAPLFYAKSGVPQNANLRMVPGQILPFELAAVQFPSMPMDLYNSMQGTRQVAEQLMAVPDVGTGRAVDPSKNKTAAETNLIASIMGQTADVRARLFRSELGHLLNLAWGILVQYQKETVEYYFRDELLKVEPAVFDGRYRIEPNGSGDNVNRGLVLQRAISRKQMFTNNPNINQKELDRSVLEADDPRLVKRLLVNEGTQAAEQIEDQAQELSIMLMGFPAQVRPADDDASHLQSMAGFVQRRAQLGEPLTPEFLRLVAGHAEAHMAALKKKNPQVWQQRGQQLQGWLAEVKQQSMAQPQSGMQPAGAAPQNAGPGPAATMGMAR
jgi:hypothetical protein